MRLLVNLNLLKLFFIAFATTVVLFVADIIVTNRLPTNNARIVCDLVIRLLVLPLYVTGSVKAVKQKRWDWLGLNILLLIIIIALVIWSILIEYAFQDFKLVLPA